MKKVRKGLLKCIGINVSCCALIVLGVKNYIRIPVVCTTEHPLTNVLKGKITIRIVVVSYFQTFGFYSNYEEKVELYFLLIKIIFKNLYQISFSKYPALVPDT